MPDLTTTVGTFDLPDCAPADGVPVELSNGERTDRIIITNIETDWDPRHGPQMDFDLFDENCAPLAAEVEDYWEQDILDEVSWIIKSWC